MSRLFSAQPLCFASVVCVIDRWNGTTVAIVKMRQGGMVTEAQIMQRLGTHPNLVQFYRWARDARGSEYMIMELLQQGSLYKLLSTDHNLDFKDKLKVPPPPPPPRPPPFPPSLTSPLPHPNPPTRSMPAVCLPVY